MIQHRVFPFGALRNLLQLNRKSANFSGSRAGKSITFVQINVTLNTDTIVAASHTWCLQTSGCLITNSSVISMRWDGSGCKLGSIVISTTWVHDPRSTSGLPTFERGEPSTREGLRLHTRLVRECIVAGLWLSR